MNTTDPSLPLCPFCEHPPKVELIPKHYDSRYEKDISEQVERVGCGWIGCPIDRVTMTREQWSHAGESEYLRGKKIAAWQLEEREATVCPEDVGFEEYIKILERKLGEAEGSNFKTAQRILANTKLGITEQDIAETRSPRNWQEAHRSRE